MSAPLVPSPLDYIGRRRFAFYPAIVNAGPNEWILGMGSWTEVQVLNARSGLELWVPRQHIGAVSEGPELPLTVGLRKALDFREGHLAPCVKRVIEMPHEASRRRVPKGFELGGEPQGGAAVVTIRLEQRSKSRFSKVTGSLAIAAMLTALLAAWANSIGR